MASPYTTTAEYRIFLRNLVGMDATKYYGDATVVAEENGEDLDEETADEYNYDERAISAYLDKVYLDTKASVEFSMLYNTAAALMISTDPEIGLAVLMSYDYLALFCACYSEYMRAPAAFSQNSPQFKMLMEKMTRK